MLLLVVDMVKSFSRLLSADKARSSSASNVLDFDFPDKGECACLSGLSRKALSLPGEDMEPSELEFSRRSKITFIPVPPRATSAWNINARTHLFISACVTARNNKFLSGWETIKLKEPWLSNCDTRVTSFKLIDPLSLPSFELLYHFKWQPWIAKNRLFQCGMSIPFCPRFIFHK